MKTRYQPNSHMQAVLDCFEKFSSPRIETLSPENARNVPTLKNAAEELAASSMASRALGLAMPDHQRVASVKHQLIPGPGGDLLARIYTPEGTGPFPVLVYFHGGGWVIANLDVYDPSCRALCNAAECIVISVAYRQAPEHKFPAAVEDARAATRWAMENAASFNGRPNRVAVGGESAGGNLAAVVCLAAKEKGEPMPIAQLLIYPVTDSRMEEDSYHENEEAIPLSKAMMEWFWKQYLGDAASGQQPYAAPLLAKDLSGLPPAIVITAEIDPVRDEGEAYAKRLSDAGVPVKATRYTGVTHEFFGLASAVPEARKAIKEAAAGLKKAFDR